jgi:tRNA pseudouridine32 synthase / 23S rRNA pseudouridine746 synthase
MLFRMNFALLHADDDLIVVDKPEGLLAVPGRGADKQDCLATRVQTRWPDALVVHRLDMATSGLMLLARGKANQRVLSMAFEAREVHKRYVAVIAGLMAGHSGVIDLPLAADWPRRPLQKVDHSAGKPALTRWRVLDHDAGRSQTRLELEPVTGRTHQLRVHLQAIGHPIIGDRFYAPSEASADTPADLRSVPPRLLLHASRLDLIHPASGAAMSFDRPPPF